MKDKTNMRTRWLSVRLSEAEEKKVLRFYQSTTAQGMSEYVRQVLLKEPVTVLFRNASADAFLVEMIRLKNELAAIGNNLDDMVKKLHALNHVGDIKAWAILNESHQRALQKKTAEILEKVSEIYALWLQK